LDVAKKGCPYTVGMAEPIDTDAATRFSEAFYGELFRIVKSRLPAGVTGAVEMDLAPAVIPARKIIHDHCNATPNNFGRWLLPLLYEVAEQPLVVLSLPPELARKDPGRRQEPAPDESRYTARRTRSDPGLAG
jgi:hypothetical protein